MRTRVEALGIEGGVIKQLGRLQQTIETESQQFSAMAGAAKARHDVAMNAIRNMKG